MFFGNQNQKLNNVGNNKPSGLKKFCATPKISRVLDVKPSNKVCVFFRAVTLTNSNGIKKKHEKLSFILVGITMNQ